jgi:hypothetical protein
MSEIKVNKISPRAACGTVTLGDSGDTFTIPAGATITNAGTANGFGATGAVNWQTTVKTSGFTATAGEGYFINTTGGVISVNLPAGTPGAVVGFKDYAGTFNTNQVSLIQNGSDKIGGETINGKLSTAGIAVTLVFVDSTQGWLVTDSGLQTDAPTASYIVATGGTITNSPCGDFKIHTFASPGTFTVCSVGNASGSNSVDYLVLAGGGGGGSANGGGGGGGAGGYRESSGAASGCYTASPLGSGVSALPVTATGFPITVGAGGAGAVNPGPSGAAGSNSVFSTITSTGGGRGGSNGAPNGTDGGSGGAGGHPAGSGGSGNTPPVSPSQGNNGGNGAGNTGGGGGGAGAVGANASSCAAVAGAGGTGVISLINASSVTRGGGGGGNSESNTGGAGGAGGGGAGASGNGSDGGDGTANTGGGGGGVDANPAGFTAGDGGSGIVIIRYKFQN